MENSGFENRHEGRRQRLEASQEAQRETLGGKRPRAVGDSHGQCHQDPRGLGGWPSPALGE